MPRVASQCVWQRSEHPGGRVLDRRTDRNLLTQQREIDVVGEPSDLLSFDEVTTRNRIDCPRVPTHDFLTR